MRFALTPAETAITRTQIPRPLTSFVGRAGEIDAVIRLIAQAGVRLLTLTGPGGIGKTRLALEVAHRLSPSFDDRVYFAGLAPVRQPADVLPTIAEAMGLWDTQSATIPRRVTLTLPPEPVLLVLDNFEHLVDAAPVVADLLRDSPQLAVLATSRAPLHIQGEREYSVPQLETPEVASVDSTRRFESNESIALFIDRARSVNHALETDDESLRAIAEICARLDGLPLAIELAAARSKVLPLPALMERLDNRLQILRTTARDLPPRLKTMRATIDWSYELLEPDEKAAFCLLSVFAGDISLSGASAVLGVSEVVALDTIDSLLDKSLLLARDPAGEQPYYRMLAVVREFGLERLEQSGQSADARQRLADYVAALAERTFDGLLGPEQGALLTMWDREHDNVRFALHWAAETDQWLLAARIAAHLWQFWDVRGHLSEGRAWYERILAQPVDYPRALLPNLYYGHAVLASTADDAKASSRLARRLVQIAEETGDRFLLAAGKNLIGFTRQTADDIYATVQALAFWEELGETVRAGLAAGEISRVARTLGDLDTAESYAVKSYDLLRKAGHVWGIGLAASGVGRVRQLRGNLAGAAEMYREGMNLLRGIGDRIVILRHVEFMAEMAGTIGNLTVAVRLAGASARMRQIIGYEIRYASEAESEHAMLKRARAALGDDRYEREWLAGQRLSVDEAVDLAASVDPQAEVEAEKRDAPQSNLTRRERDVLRLIVTGKTDQEIADDLFVSYRTVTTHVTNILNKLNVNSRTEAAAVAVRDRLTE